MATEKIQEEVVARGIEIEQMVALMGLEYSCKIHLLKEGCTKGVYFNN